MKAWLAFWLQQLGFYISRLGKHLEPKFDSPLKVPEGGEYTTFLFDSKCASCEKWFLVEDYLCPSCRAGSV